MNKGIYKAVIATVLASTCASAFATDYSGFFVNGEVAGSDANISGLSDTTSTAGAVRLGYMWGAGVIDWGVEGGYVDLGNVSGNVYVNNYGYVDNIHVSVKTRGELLGGNFKVHFGDSGWFYSTRIGWFHSSAHLSTNARFGNYFSSATGDGAYVGMGLGYDFTPHAGIAFNYDDYNSSADGIYNRRFNTGVYGATFEYRF